MHLHNKQRDYEDKPGISSTNSRQQAWPDGQPSEETTPCVGSAALSAVLPKQPTATLHLGLPSSEPGRAATLPAHHRWDRRNILHSPAATLSRCCQATNSGCVLPTVKALALLGGKFVFTRVTAKVAGNWRWLQMVFHEDLSYQWKDPMSGLQITSYFKSFIINAYSTASWNFICLSMLEIDRERLFQIRNMRLESCSKEQLLLYTIPAGALILLISATSGLQQSSGRMIWLINCTKRSS